MIYMDNVVDSRSSSGVVVKLLAYRARVLGSSPGFAATIEDICYILLLGCDMTEIMLKHRNSSKQPNPALLVSVLVFLESKSSVV